VPGIILYFIAASTLLYSESPPGTLILNLIYWTHWCFLLSIFWWASWAILINAIQKQCVVFLLCWGFFLLTRH